MILLHGRKEVERERERESCMCSGFSILGYCCAVVHVEHSIPSEKSGNQPNLRLIGGKAYL